MVKGSQNRLQVTQLPKLLLSCLHVLVVTLSSTRNYSLWCDEISTLHSSAMAVPIGRTEVMVNIEQTGEAAQMSDMLRATPLKAASTSPDESSSLHRPDC